MAEKVIVGADEAGRGLIIGPMIIGACAINGKIAEAFYEMGIRDSKRYTSQNKLARHANFIKRASLAWTTKEISAEVLNNFNKNKMTMDEAEAYAFLDVIVEISKKVSSISEYQVDNFQATALLRKLLKQNKKTENVRLTVIPQAETQFIAVSAGAILAREQSLKELVKIKKKYGDFGSGSTSDKRTILWLKKYYEKNGSWPESIVRTFWKTITKIEKGLL